MPELTRVGLTVTCFVAEFVLADEAGYRRVEEASILSQFQRAMLRLGGHTGSQRIVRLDGMALATSGIAANTYTVAGRRYSHILDPLTGWPVEEAPRSVTVAAPTCTLAGMTATFAMLQGANAEEFLENEGFEYWVFR